ncbi:MAG: helix-turn-helix transcriptional regulator [Ruminococcaceae bacterium]|nr:helix-turn-helix transcriptional regulator [Oscillospiraceae bacterium]
MEHTMGKRIVYHRKRLGLTQDQFAEKLGVTAQAVSKWENDQSCPDIYMIPKIAELFGITSDELLGMSGAEAVETPQKEEKSGWEFHWDSGRRGAVTTAFFVLVVGALLFAARLLEWDVGFWGIAWPSALLVYSLASLFHRFNFTGVVCAALGGYFLVNNLGVFEFYPDKKLLFPALVILVGISLLTDALRKPKKGRFSIHKKGNVSHKQRKHFTQEGEEFNCSIAFGEVEHHITLPRLSCGKANVSFGEMKLDLRGCGEIAENCEIDIGASFGSLHLNVPAQYRVECAAGTSFGEISTHGRPDEHCKGTITLTGGVSFGELEIYYL